MKIALDALGGDFGARPNVLGALKAVKIIVKTAVIGYENGDVRIPASGFTLQGHHLVSFTSGSTTYNINEVVTAKTFAQDLGLLAGSREVIKVTFVANYVTNKYTITYKYMSIIILWRTCSWL